MILFLLDNLRNIDLTVDIYVETGPFHADKANKLLTYFAVAYHT